jgi:hypothetical protein
MIFHQEPNLTLYQGHALSVLKELPDESVDCVLTSPPYLTYPPCCGIIQVCETIKADSSKVNGLARTRNLRRGSTGENGSRVGIKTGCITNMLLTPDRQLISLIRLALLKMLSCFGCTNIKSLPGQCLRLGARNTGVIVEKITPCTANVEKNIIIGKVAIHLSGKGHTQVLNGRNSLSKYISGIITSAVFVAAMIRCKYIILTLSGNRHCLSLI